MVETTVTQNAPKREEAQRSPVAVRLEQRADGRLWALRDGDEHPVSVRRLFPWSRRNGHVSLRDRKNREIALVAEASGLDAASRAALEDALVVADFVLEIARVIDVEEEIEIRVWQVETRQGPRTFQTRLDDWPREIPGGGVLVRDVAGDLYHVADPNGLDKRSQELLWAFVD